MKNGKKPTLAQKKFLQGKGLVPENWLIVKDSSQKMPALKIMEIIIQTNIFLFVYLLLHLMQKLSVPPQEWLLLSKESLRLCL